MNDSTNPRTTADRLRTVADLLDAHPDLPVPYVTTPGTQVHVSWYLHHDGVINGTDAELLQFAQQVVKALGGTWAKRGGDDVLYLEQERDGVGYTVAVAREQACTRRVVGTEQVTIPARPAVEAQPERVETRDVVEWDCGPILGGRAEQDQAVSA